MNRVKATARVRITLEFPVGDSWGGECSTDQIQKQAKESAMAILRNARQPEGHVFPRSVLADLLDRRVAQIVGEPTVTAVLVESIDG